MTKKISGNLLSNPNGVFLTPEAEKNLINDKKSQKKSFTKKCQNS